MENNPNNEKQQERELSIIDVIVKLWKGKWIIAIITIICLAISIFYSWVLIDEKYISRATILANPIEEVNFSTPTYADEIKNDTVLKKTIDDLGLKDENGQEMSIGSLKGIISVSPVENTNYIDILVKHTDPQIAMQVANAVSENFISYISEEANNKGTDIAKEIEDQMVVEETMLNEKSQNLKEFLENNKSANTLEIELEYLIKQSASFKTQLNEQENNLRASELLLSDLYNLAEDSGLALSGSIELFISPQSNEDESIIKQIKSDSLEESLLIIEISETETSVFEARANIQSLKKSIDELESQVTQTQLLFIDNEYQYNNLYNEYEIVKSSYLDLQQNLKAASDIANTDIGKNSIELLSMAVAAGQPSEPDKTKNVIIALIIGLVIGAGVVLFREYWLEAKPQKAKRKRSVKI